MQLIIHALTPTAIYINHRCSLGIGEESHPTVFVDVIIYPSPNPCAGLTNLFLELGIG